MSISSVSESSSTSKPKAIRIWALVKPGNLRIALAAACQRNSSPVWRQISSIAPFVAARSNQGRNRDTPGPAVPASRADASPAGCEAALGPSRRDKPRSFQGNADHRLIFAAQRVEQGQHDSRIVTLLEQLKA